MIRAYDEYGNIVDLVEWEKKIRSKAIDDFAKLVEIWCWKHEQYNQDDLNRLMDIAEQLKAGAGIGTDNQ